MTYLKAGLPLLLVLVSVISVPPAVAGSEDPAALSSLRAEALSIAGVCRADFNRLCHGVKLGGGRAIVCLQANKESLAPDCRQALPRAIDLKAAADRAGVTPK